MTAILTADIHQTDEPRDEPRWELFPWLEKQARKTGAKHALLLGDLTEKKDNHSSVLVNRMVRALRSLAEVCEVIILKGNHDFFDEKLPYFGFLNGVSRITYISEPEVLEIDDGLHANRRRVPALFLPCTKDWKAAWSQFNLNEFGYIFTHATFDGVKAENGSTLRGIPPSFFAGIKAKVWSGDIHVAQKVSKNIEYVGSPYKTKFDNYNYQPRCVLLRKGEAEDLIFPGALRELLDVRSLAELEKVKTPKGAQVKIRVRLKRAEYEGWPKFKQAAAALASQRGWQLCGMELRQWGQNEPGNGQIEAMPASDPRETLEEFGKRRKLAGPLMKLGRSLLKEAGS